MSNVKQILRCQILCEFREVDVFVASEKWSDTEQVQLIALDDAKRFVFRLYAMSTYAYAV